MKEKKTLNRSTPRGLTPTPLIEVQTSFGAQPENGHVKGDYSDTLLAARSHARTVVAETAMPRPFSSRTIR